MEQSLHQPHVEATRRRRPTDRGSYLFLESPRESTSRVVHQSNSRSVCESHTRNLWEADKFTHSAPYEHPPWQPRARALTSVGGRQSVSAEDPSIYTSQIEPEGSQLSDTICEMCANISGMTDVCHSLMERVKSLEAQLVIAHKHLLERISDVSPLAARIAERLRDSDDFVNSLGDKVADRISDSLEAGIRAEVIAKDVVNMTVPLLENIITKSLSKCKQQANHPSPLPPRNLLLRSSGVALMDSLTYSDQSPSTDLYNSLIFTPNLISPFTFYRSTTDAAHAGDEAVGPPSLSSQSTTETLAITPPLPAPPCSRLAADSSEPVSTPRPTDKLV